MSAAAPQSGKDFARPAHVTLIHGTFARETAWVKSGSALRSALEAEMRGAVDFDVFPWDGRNDHQSRQRAAAELAEQMNRAVRDKPDHRHWIIAHSHGGNIAIAAAKQEPGGSALEGLVCLATPFFALTFRRGLQALPSVLRWIAVFMVVTYALFITMWMVLPGFRKLGKLGTPANLHELLTWAYILAVVIFYLLLDRLFSKRIVSWLAGLAARRAKEFQFSVSPALEVLCLAGSMDEVRLAFRSAYKLSRLSAFLLSWRGIIAVFALVLVPLVLAGRDAVHVIGARGGFAIFAANAYILLPLALVTDFFAPESWIDPLMPLIAAILTLVTVALLGLISMIGAMLIHYVATALRFGWAWRWKLFDTFLFEVDVSSTPPGVDHAVTRTVPIRGFSHTTLCDSPDVQRAIVKLIRGNSKPTR